MGLHRPGALNPNWKGGNVSVTCEVCSKSLEVPRNRLARFRACSRRCASRLAMPMVQRGRGGRVTRPCDECGREYQTWRSHVAKKRFCSSVCHAAWRSRRMAESGNPSWAGGLSRNGYPFVWSQRRRAVLERDGHRCRGPFCRGTDRRLTVHHIDYDKNNCDPSNLITLCSSCNTRANFRRAMWRFVYECLMVAA